MLTSKVASISTVLLIWRSTPQKIDENRQGYFDHVIDGAPRRPDNTRDSRIILGLIV